MLKYMLSTVLMIASLFAGLVRIGLDYQSEVELRGADYSFTMYAADMAERFGFGKAEAAPASAAEPVTAAAGYALSCSGAATGAKICRVSRD